MKDSDKDELSLDRGLAIMVAEGRVALSPGAVLAPLPLR
jgi:hypothetical protein